MRITVPLWCSFLCRETAYPLGSFYNLLWIFGGLTFHWVTSRCGSCWALKHITATLFWRVLSFLQFRDIFSLFSLWFFFLVLPFSMLFLLKTLIRWILDSLVNSLHLLTIFFHSPFSPVQKMGFPSLVQIFKLQELLIGFLFTVTACSGLWMQ